MRSKLLCVLLVLTILFAAGCGGGGGESSITQTQPQYNAPNILDVPITNGTGQVTINTNCNVETLIAIPYNTATNAGSYETTVTINADSQDLLTLPVTSRINTKMKSDSDFDFDSAFKAKLRDQERKLIGLLRSQNKLMSTKSTIMPTKDFKDDNQTRTFNKFYDNTWHSVPATKIYKGDRCLIYLDNNATGTYLTQNNIEQLGKAFDSFYDTEVKYFGTPAGTLGDVDNNDMIYILLTELEHSSTEWVVGYFHSVHEFLASEYQYSNQKEMLFITTYKPNGFTESAWLSTIKSTLAHEFQHLIFFNNRATKYQYVSDYNSEVWINEGLSMVAEDLAIKGPEYKHNPDLDDRVKAYLQNSSYDSLCTWNNNVADYAPAYMFMRYFVDRFTEEKIKSLIVSNEFGTNMLTSVAGGTTFTQLFRDWLAAVVLDRINYSYNDANLNNIYLYKTLDLSSYSNVTFGQLNSSSSIVIPDTTGGYIIKTGLSDKQQISIAIQGHSVFGLRLITLPAGSYLNQTLLH